MSDLFTMLRAATRALDAQRYGLDVAGQNIANVNTPGYARRSVELAEVPPYDPWSPGGGVDVAGVTAARAPLIEARIRFEQPASAREGAIADRLSVIAASLGEPGQSIDGMLARFYNTYGTLAQNPTSSTARQQVIVEGQALSRSFNDMATRFETAQRDADSGIRDTVAQVNTLAQRIAQINIGIAAVGGNNSDSLIDQLQNALSSLSDVIDANVIQHDDGSVDVTIGNGRALVIGATTYDLSVASAPGTGFAQILSSGASSTVDVTSEITGGSLGGLIQVRDVYVPNYISQLDQLAYSVATDVNGLTTSGFDLNGTAGVDFFDQPAGVSGAARQMGVNGAVAADSSLVVAAATAASGDNDIARAVASLQDVPMGGSSARPIDAWGTLVYNVGTDTRSALESKMSREQVAQQLRNLRDQISGVSIDEEAAMLMRFQRAYEANARFFQVADQTLDLLMQLVGG